MKAKLLETLIAPLRKLFRLSQGGFSWMRRGAKNSSSQSNPLFTRRKIRYPAARELIGPREMMGYELVGTRERTEEAFLAIRSQVLRRCRAFNQEHPGLPAFFIETGLIDPGRRYFYVKPKNAPGWLVEESTSGWVVSRSEKIVGQDLFLRKGEAWDIASLFQKGTLPRPRVSSSLTRDQIISLALYGRILERAILESVQGGRQ